VAIPFTEVSSFMHQTASQRSVPDDQVKEHLPDNGDQGSIPNQRDFL
jgi:hypothetical protein